MLDILAGVSGGLGLFIVGMWFLTENLKNLASRRLRLNAQRWTKNRYTALLWGVLGGTITQSMTALTFVVVSILRSRLITLKGALAMILGGGVGVTALVLVVTFDIKVIALYVVGIAGFLVASEQFSKYRAIAAAFLGAAMIILGLVLLREAAAPLADQPWFQDTMEETGNSLFLAFAVAALLTFAVQSSGAVSIFGISLAAIDVISIDQAIMIIYGSFVGSSAILYMLSASLRGRSRQIVMYMVSFNMLICSVAVPLLLAEIYLDVPSMKALVFATGLDLDQQLALVYVISSVALLPVMLAGLEVSGRVLERLWPVSEIDELSHVQFIHDHASVDVETSLMLVDLEQKRVFRMLSLYFDHVRQRKNIRPIREATRTVLLETDEFLKDLQNLHPLQGVEGRNALINRQKVLTWLVGAMAVKCGALLELGDHPSLRQFETSICEGVDSVILTIVSAMESDDSQSWEIASQLTGDRGVSMRRIRSKFLEANLSIRKLDMMNVVLITNAVEEVFFLMSKLQNDFNPYVDENGLSHPA